MAVLKNEFFEILYLIGRCSYEVLHHVLLLGQVAVELEVLRGRGILSSGFKDRNSRTGSKNVKTFLLR